MERQMISDVSSDDVVNAVWQFSNVLSSMQKPKENHIDTESLQELITDLIQSNLRRLEAVTYTAEEVAEMLNIKTDGKRKVDELRRSKCLKAFKLGREFVFTKKAIDEFVEDYQDYDLSSYTKMQIAYIQQQKKCSTSHKQRTLSPR